MTTFSFTPSALAPFQFQPTFDGSIYTVIVTWNLAGQRYYVNVYDLSGNLIYCLPLIASNDTAPVNMNGGYFASSFAFLESSQLFVVTP